MQTAMNSFRRHKIINNSLINNSNSLIAQSINIINNTNKGEDFIIN